MGEYADEIIDNHIGDWRPTRRSARQESSTSSAVGTKSCNRCGASGLHWRQVDGKGWRLFHGTKMHVCPPVPADTVEEEQKPVPRQPVKPIVSKREDPEEHTDSTPFDGPTPAERQAAKERLSKKPVSNTRGGIVSKTECILEFLRIVESDTGNGDQDVRDKMRKLADKIKYAAQMVD